MNNLESIINELETEIEKGKKFFGFSMLNKDALLSLLNSLRKEIPSVIRESQEIVKRKDDIIQEAIDLSLKRTQQAQETADYLVSTADVTIRAQNEARLILEDADKRAFDIEADSKKRIDNLLSTTEKILVNHLNIVRNNREELSGELLKQYQPPQRTREIEGEVKEDEE
jgi:cell division septum initiation protein DivIVA